MTTTKKTTRSTSTPQAAPPAAAPPAAPPPVTTPPATPPPVTTTPDPNAALEQYVQQTVTQLDAVEVGLGGDPPLTPTQKRHAVKLRKGGAAIVTQIGNLAQQAQLDSTALSVSTMTSTLAKSQALQPLADRLAAFSKHVTDVIFTAQSDAMSMGQQFYAVLQRRAKTDAELTTALQPVAAFFAYRHPSTKAAGTPRKPTQKATKKALKTLQKNAPQMLQGDAGAEQTTAAAAPGAPAAPAEGATGNGAAAAPGSGAVAPAATTSTSHS